MEQSFEEEGRTGAASDIVKVTDWGFKPLLIRRYNKTKPHTHKESISIIKQSNTPKQLLRGRARRGGGGGGGGVTTGQEAATAEEET